MSIYANEFYEGKQLLKDCILSRASAALIGALLLSAGQAQARSVAVLVGVGDYIDPQLDIPGVGRDIDRASSTRLEADDQLYLYFSTHGLQLTDNDGDEADGRDEAFALADFAIEGSGKEQKVTGALRDDRLAELLEAMPQTRNVIIADTCHSGTINKGISDVLVRIGKFIQMPYWLSAASATPIAESAVSGGEELEQSGTVLLSAAGDGELADIDTDGSVFTRALAATMEDPELDNAWCWFQRARTQVRQQTGGVQWPQFQGGFSASVQPMLHEDNALIDGVSILQKCMSRQGLTAHVSQPSGEKKLLATSDAEGWVTTLAVREMQQDLSVQPLARRWHHGNNKSATLRRSVTMDRENTGSLVLWTADALELPAYRGDFSVLWKSLISAPNGQWASAWLPEVYAYAE